MDGKKNLFDNSHMQDVLFFVLVKKGQHKLCQHDFFFGSFSSLLVSSTDHVYK
jgi:hypothetical protein